jgi:Ca-activated chloride channel family protein
MEAWGSTWGEGGINKAYEIAEKYFIEGGNNRVILCTDGDFNVGVSSEAGLKELISKKRESGIFFSCLGFGEGNYSDTTMETLADNGNGNYFYIDSPREAEKALNEEFFSTIYTVAKDAKFQIEFNPETVKGYRQVGYENRAMSAEDFADDTKDGGEIGAGTTVTVLYEIIPAGSDFEIPSVSSKYQKEAAGSSSASGELLTVNLRYKEPDEDTSVLREYPVSMDDFSPEMDPDTSWAAGVAQAGMLLRDSEYSGTSSFEAIYDRLKENEDIMEDDYKAEFMFLLRLMKK